MAERLLTSIMPFDYVLEEGAGKKLKIRGIFQKAETVNENNRIYPRHILEREVNKLQPLIKERRLLGQLNHPNSIEIDLERVSHLITFLKMEGNDVIGEAEVLSGTPYGAILESLLKNNVKLGISSRGKGTTRYRNGVDEVNEDYKMITFDIVSRPSTPNAFPEPIVESAENKNNKKIINIDVLIEKVLNNELTEKEIINLLKDTKNKTSIII